MLNKMVIITISLLFTTFIQAAARQADDGAAAKAQYLLRQIAAERDALNIENTRHKKELSSLKSDHKKLKNQAEKLKMQLQDAKKNLGSTEGTLSKYKKTNDLLRKNLVKNRERTKELIVKFRNTINILRKVEGKNMEQTQYMKTQGQELTSCRKMNADLYQTGTDLLEAYDKKGIWQSLLEEEPVTGFNRVDVENIIEEYRHRMAQQRDIQKVGLISK